MTDKMTNQEAIDRLKLIRSPYMEVAVDMAIEALKQPDTMTAVLFDGISGNHKIGLKPVKQGKWVEEKDGWYGGQGCRCSSCGYGYSYKAYHEPYEFDFCPNCGAKMDGEEIGE